MGHTIGEIHDIMMVSHNIGKNDTLCMVWKSDLETNFYLKNQRDPSYNFLLKIKWSH